MQKLQRWYSLRAGTVHRTCENMENIAIFSKLYTYKNHNEPPVLDGRCTGTNSVLIGSKKGAALADAETATVVQLRG